MAGARRADRLEPEQRYARLIRAGLELLSDIPYDQLTADDVARRASVSRALVFHYFPTTSELRSALLREASSHLFGRLRAIAESDVTDKVWALIEGFVAATESTPATYRAMGRISSDGRLVEVFDDARAAMLNMLEEVLGVTTPTPELGILLRGWLVMVEDTVRQWLGEPTIPRAALIDLLYDALSALLSVRGIEAALEVH
jgi:AcrR family transcriptional regulator